MSNESPAPLKINALSAIENPQASTLILGSMPGVASLQAQQYYAHPQNAFWPIMQALYGATDLAKCNADYADRIQLILDNGIALWDVLRECVRAGSLDANIVRCSAVCNDFEQFISQHAKLTTIAFNGKTAEQLFRKRVLPGLSLSPQIRLIGLPSSSPAMATLRREQKVALWKTALLSA